MVRGSRRGLALVLTDRMGTMSAKAAKLHVAATAYTIEAPPEAAYTRPPTVGPNTVAPCQIEELHATALPKCSRGTSEGRSDELAGAWNALATPIPTRMV